VTANIGSSAVGIDADGRGHCRNRAGGTFIDGGGWKALLSDGIDHNIPTCEYCTAEFDATDGGEAKRSKDLGGSMGDGSTLGTTRNHRWKMHLE
jgi:hypothetical protein